MIGRLKGIFLGEYDEASIVIDVHGVGYVVRTVPFEEPARTGEEMELFIHTTVREDALDLYGFPARTSLEFFKLLMSVSGIGPKTALSIMSVADTASLQRAIAAGDLVSLTKLYGIGKKNAERLIVELKDKLIKQMRQGIVAMAPSGTSSDTDILEALEALGYTTTESRRALQSVPDTGLEMRERLASVLKQLGAPKR